MRRLAPLTALALLWCPMLVRAQATRDVTASAEAAHRRLAAAAEAGDVATMGSLIADQAVVIVGHDTVLRGRTAIVAALTARRATHRGAQLLFTPAATDACTDGAYESGGDYYAYLTRITSGADTLSGHYALRWGWRGAEPVVTALRVTRMTDRASLRLPCRPASHLAFGRHRLRIWGGLPFAMGSVTSYTQYRDKLTADGYAPGQGADAKNASADAGIAFRFAGPFWVEAQTDYLPERATTYGVNLGRETGVALRYKASSSSVSLAWAWRGFRAGAGPSLTRWRVQGQYRELQGAGPVIFDSTRTGTTFGVLVQASFTMPVTRRVFAELRGNGRFGGTSQSPTLKAGLPYIFSNQTQPPIRAGSGSLRLYLSMGIALD